MVKSYLRYDLKRSLGVVNSRSSNVVFDATGLLAITAALDDVIVWAHSPRELFAFDPRTNGVTEIGRFRGPDGSDAEDMTDLAVDGFGPAALARSRLRPRAWSRGGRRNGSRWRACGKRHTHDCHHERRVSRWDRFQFCQGPPCAGR